ncbi:efflux RND transporter periplasmic adaptor subunit [Pseudoduganella aquatica]|uniref:efflux RND transporter periplasmic adaptor subunit n=1 Tax=Pseudoduganella aquatica TaxID=2660641 RepID=UPI001E3ADE34|nr:efflux RND transporter periplasmic adaptor subunit [Pseudoduganella aquatica]
MKLPNLDSKSRRGVLTVLVAGVALATALLFWKHDDTSVKTAAESGEKRTEGKAAGKDKATGDKGESKADGDHADEEVVKFTDAQLKTAGIFIEKAASATIGTATQLPGEIRFNEDRTAHIVPRVDGVVESVPADLGSRVKKGQVLAVIASTGLAEMRSELLTAQKRLNLAQVTHDREKKLWQDKISAEQDYLQAQQALREAEITLQNAKQKLNALGASVADIGSLNSYTLRAPFDGVIVEKHITLGEAIKGDTNVFTISDLSAVWAEIIVSAKDLETVRVGEKATIKATSLDSKATGTVAYVGSLLGEQTRAAKARVTLQNPNMAWRPGLFVNVELVRGTKQVPVAVRADALQTVEGKTTVFVKTAEGFKAQAVTTGLNDGKYVEILTGMSAQTPYAATGSFVIKAEQGKGGVDHDH